MEGWTVKSLNTIQEAFSHPCQGRNCNFLGSITSCKAPPGCDGRAYAEKKLCLACTFVYCGEDWYINETKKCTGVVAVLQNHFYHYGLTIDAQEIISAIKDSKYQPSVEEVKKVIVDMLFQYSSLIVFN